MRLGHVADANVDVDVFRDEVDRAIEKIEPYLERRIPAAQLGQDRRDVISAETEARADAYESFGRGLAGFDRLQHLLHVVVDPLCPRVDRFAFVGDRDTPAGAVEKLDRKVRFQDRDALADVGRRSAQLVRRRRERPETGRRPEHAEVLE